MLLLPLGTALRFSSAALWRAAISSRARRFASIRTWEYRESRARETCPATLMITSSPAPDSASSVITSENSHMSGKSPTVRSAVQDRNGKSASVRRGGPDLISQNRTSSAFAVPKGISHRLPPASAFRSALSFCQAPTSAARPF